MRKNCFIIVCILFMLVSLTHAQPKIGVGIKATRFLMSLGEWYSGSPWNYDAEYEWYWGISADLMVDFTKNISLRVETVEFKKFDNAEAAGNGGTSVSIFSNLDVDIMFILPIGRRISPLIYAGMTYEEFKNKPLNDIRSLAAAYEKRIGLGAVYRLRQKTRIMLEIQIYNEVQTEPERDLYGAAYLFRIESIGLNRANLGVCFEL